MDCASEEYRMSLAELYLLLKQIIQVILIFFCLHYNNWDPHAAVVYGLVTTPQ